MKAKLLSLHEESAPSIPHDTGVYQIAGAIYYPPAQYLLIALHLAAGCGHHGFAIIDGVSRRTG